MAEVLTIELLETLRSRWEAIGAPVATQLQTGLSDRKIVDELRGLNLSPSAEALTWWQWHDGANGIEVVGGRGFGFDPLARAISDTEFYRNLAASFGEHAQDLWQSDWLAFCRDAMGGSLVLDFGDSNPSTSIAPVRYHHRDAGSSDTFVVAESLGDVIVAWIEVLDAGATSYNRAAGLWDWHPELLPSDRHKQLV